MDKKLKKWTEILDTLGIIKHKELFAEVAEHHSMVSKENALPYSLKIASKVTEFDRLMEKKRFFLSDTPVKTHLMSASISMDQHHDMMHTGIDLISDMEYALIDEAARTIDKDLKKSNMIKVHALVKEVRYEMTGDYITKITIVSDYDTKGREAKLRRILKL